MMILAVHCTASTTTQLSPNNGSTMHVVYSMSKKFSPFLYNESLHKTRLRLLGHFV